MPKLTVGGVEITGVMKAEVRITHLTDREAERVPVMEWEVIVGLTNSDYLQKWALEPESAARFKPCELQIFHRDGSVAHTWNLLKAYLHEYNEQEFPASGVPSIGEGGATDAGNWMRLLIRGTLLHMQDYTGTNVMTIAGAEEEGLPEAEGGGE